VDPVVFDSINALAGIHTRSYNTASSAVFFNEQCYLLDKYVLDDTLLKEVKHLIIELDDDVTILPLNIYTSRGSYYIRLSTLPVILKQIVVSNLTFGEKFSQCYYHIASLIRYSLHMGHGRQRLQGLLFGFPVRASHDESGNNGFMPQGIHLSQYATTGWKERHELLMRDTMQIHRSCATFDSLSQHKMPSDIYNPVVLKRYLRFLTKMRERDITVIYLIPARRVISPQLVSLYNALPEGHKINMIASQHFKTLCAARYWFDSGHLNERGATIYSRLIAYEFQALSGK
jgi:hypothetical protein